MADKDKKTPDIIGKRLQYSLNLQRADVAIDEEKRTAEMSFASDAPIRHWFGNVILDMKPESVMLDRFKTGAALLVCHDRNQQVGIIENPTLSDGMFRGSARFSKSAFAEEIYQDVKDEIRKTTSLTFIIHDLILEESTDEDDTYRATLWEPIEGSLEPIPADISCGVGRSLEDAPPSAESLALPVTDPSGAARAINQPTIETRNAMLEENVNTESAELTRAREIHALGELLTETELARDFIAGTQTPDEFKAAVKAKRVAAQATTPAEEPEAVAARNGGTVVSMSRHSKIRSFKGTDAEKRAHRFGMFLLAGPLGRSIESPVIQRAREFCRTNGIALQRAHTESVNEDGGFNVPTEFGNDLIDLREEYGVFRPNTKVVPMASDTKTEPRRTGGLTAYAVGETQTITESKKGWDRVSLVAKKFGVLAKYSTELNEDAVISIGDDLASEIAYAFAQKEDECGFNGDGSSTYHGIVGVRAKLKNLSGTIANIAGLVVAAGNLFSEFTLNDFLKVKGRLPAYVWKRTQPKWYCHQQVFTDVMEALALAAGGVSAAEIIRGATSGQPTFLGQPVEFAQTMPNTDANSQIPVVFGGLSLASMMGDKRGVTISMTDSNDTDFEQDLMSIKGTTRFDINVHDVGNAHATAASRVPGPVVGLISAAS
jgi:HK97 family phage major capsid protein